MTWQNEQTLLDVEAGEENWSWGVVREGGVILRKKTRPR